MIEIIKREFSMIHFAKMEENGNKNHKIYVKSYAAQERRAHAPLSVSHPLALSAIVSHRGAAD
jgi:hypothetical protein